MERRRRLSLSFVLLLAIATCASRARADEEPKSDEPKSTVAKPTESDYELYQVFADTLDQIERNYVKDVSRRELMEAAIQGVLGKLDPYSNYISPEDITRFKSSVEQQFGGIGIQIGVEDGQLKVISPLTGTPAYRAGLESGDAILEINGKSTEGIQIDEAVKQLKGEAGTKVTLTVRHAGAREKVTMTIAREMVHVDTVLGDKRRADDQWDYMLDHDKHIGYIRITAFSRDTARDVKKALTELKQEGLKGLVLDLRFNPGGLLNSAIEVSDLFVTSGRIVSTKGRNTPERVWEAQAEGTFEGFPMVVLVNHYSASASEILSACLQDHKRAVIIGERTWGKGSVQNVVELEGGKSALKLTTAAYHRPSGKNIHRYPDAQEKDVWGVMPDDGYEVKLNGGQTARLIESRRRRDILVGKHAKALATNEPGSPDAKSEPAATPEVKSEEKPEAKPEESPKAEEAKPEAAKPDEVKTEAAKDAAPAEEPKAEEKKADEKKPEATEAGEKPADQKPGDAKPAEDKPAAEHAFVDVQLQKALDYLTAELAKAP